MVRNGFLPIIVGVYLAALLGCDLSSTENSATSPINSSAKLCPQPSYDVTSHARFDFNWPCNRKKGCDRDDFWKWFLRHSGQRNFLRTIYFDNLNKNALSKVHLESETLTVQSLSLVALDDDDFDHMIISLNGFRGQPITKDAISVKVQDLIVFNRSFNALEKDLFDSDDDGNVFPSKSKGDELDEGDSLDDGKGKAKGHRQRKFKTVKLIEITFHLEDFVFGVNKTAADLIRETAIKRSSLQFKIRHVRGPIRTFNRTLRLQGHFPGECSSPTPPPAPAPIVSINSTSVGLLTNSPDIEITFSANQTSTFTCSLDQNPYASCSSPFRALQLADGAHHFSVIPTNSAGITGDPAHFDWTIDTTAPVVTLDSVRPSEILTSQNQITFNFSADESASFECRLDSSSWGPCSSPVSLNALQDGGHSFEIKALDLAGNISQTTIYPWTVKTTAPVVTITQSIPSSNPTNVTTREIQFTGTADTVAFYCALDTQTRSLCTSPFSSSQIIDGAHSISVWGIDGAGNISSPATLSFTLDTLSPDAFIVSTSPSHNPTNQRAISLSFSSNESSTFECSIDSLPKTNCTSPNDLFSLSDGAHTFEVVATDIAGNVSTPAKYNWTVDTVAPEITLSSVEPAQRLIKQNSITFIFSSSEGGQISCSLNNSALQDCSGGSVTFSSLIDGTYVASFVARDMAGNLSPTFSYSFEVDLTEPNVQITSVAPIETLTKLTSISFEFTSNELALFECRIDGGAFGSCTSPASYSQLADGSHTFQARGIDNAGNISSSPASYSWTVDTIAPSTIITNSPGNGTTSPSATATFEFQANETGSFECSLDNTGFSTCNSPMTFNGLADGDHTFEVFAIDVAGNRDPVGAKISWAINTQPLMISNFSVGEITKNSAVVSWTTNIPSTSQVAFSLSPPTTYQFTAVDNTLTTNHSVQLTGLQGFGLYTVYGISSTLGQQTSSGTAVFRTLR